MNSLILHIEYLLLRHDCVIVPGLGAFIATYVPARIDMENGSLLPPSRSVVFNQAVSTDDGLLANSIARKFNLSFEEARQVMFREIGHIKQKLATERIFTLEKIGSLSLSEENTLLFSPVSGNDALAYIPGYNPIYPSSLAKKKVVTEVKKHRIKYRFGRRFGKIAASIALTASIAIASFLYPFPSDNREQRASVMPVENLFVKSDEPARVTKIIEEKVDSTPLADESLSRKHYLIVATFSTQQEAERYAADNSTAEFPLITVASRKVIRVAAASSDNREDLQKRLNSKTFISRFSNPWIWSRN